MKWQPYGWEMGVVFCYVSVTNGIKRKKQRLCWEAERYSTSTKRFRNLWNQIVRYSVRNSPPLVPILSQNNPLRPSSYYSLKMYYNLSSHYTSFSNWCLSFPFRNQIPSCISFCRYWDLIAYKTCALSNISLIIKFKPNNHTDKYSPFIAHSYSISRSQVFSSEVTFVQNCQWFDIPVTLVHMNVVKWNTEWNWDGDMFDCIFQVMNVLKTGDALW
jgi:hypothetical protein